MTNDGLFVTTRSGKGGTFDIADALEDGDPVLKRKVASILLYCRCPNETFYYLKQLKI